tara:strand:+ start:603 stop:896 length:294 start_codon:yes stop_codon:yes gene_type:complete
MTERVLLSSEELQSFSGRMPQWTVNEIAIERVFKFANFVEAFAFMTAVAMHCERLDHHPEWSNVYSTVNVRLTTHDQNGITRLDLALADVMEELADG